MSEPIRIVEVDPGSKAERDFISLPFTIYRNNPHYVPRFSKQIKNIIARKHPYFTHSDGEFFLALRNEEPVGRITLLEPRRYNEHRNKKEARFCFFEAKDDLDAARAMFRHAEEWAKARGLNRLVGPQGLSVFDGSGILLDSYDKTASMRLIPYHLPYYRELIEACGFEKSHDFFSAEINAKTRTLPTKYQRIADISLKRGRFSLLPLDSKRELKSLAHDIGRIYNSTWEDHGDFTPLTEEELEQLKGKLLRDCDPSLIKLIRSGEEPAGFVLALPDSSRAMIKAKGRMDPLKKLSLEREKRRTDKFLINSIGILPEHRRTGGMAVLFYELSRALRRHHAKRVVLTQIAESNVSMMRNVKELQPETYKTHRVYQKPVG